MKKISIFIGVGYMIAGYVTGITKKAMTLDKEYLLVLVLFLIVLFSSKVFAIGVIVPQEVDVFSSATFYATVTNDTKEMVPLQVHFFAPVAAQVSAPTTLAPGASVSVQIIVGNKYTDARTIQGTLEVKTGDVTTQKSVNLVFHPTQASTNTANNQAVGRFMSGVFSFSSFAQETAKFSLIDWVAFWILVIIAAVLVIAFVARVRRR